MILTIFMVSLDLRGMDKKRKNLSAAEEFDRSLEAERELARRRALPRANEQLRNFCKNRSLKPVLDLLADNIDLNEKDDVSGMSALHYAAACGDYSLVKLLLLKGADIKSRDKTHLTPLHCAASEGHEDVIELLCRFGASVDVVATKNVTPFHLAAENGHLECCRALHDAGCSLTELTAQGRTALHLAASHNRVDVARYLLSKGVALHAKNVGDHTALHEAVMKGYQEMIRLLLDHEPNKASMSGELLTAFHMVLDHYLEGESGKREVLKLLLESGCNPNGLSSEGYTPLHRAILSNDVSLVEILLIHGADMRARTPMGELLPSGFTPLQLAAQGVQWEICKLLVEKGEDPYEKTPDGRQSVQLAYETNRPGSAALAVALKFKNFIKEPS
jgi:ankyrin repeat protein